MRKPGVKGRARRAFSMPFLPFPTDYDKIAVSFYDIILNRKVNMAGRNKVEKRFNSDLHIERIISLYNNLV